MLLQEILLMKQRVAEMEQEADKLRQLQAAAETATEGGGDAIVTDEDKAAADGRSIFVGNVSRSPFLCYPSFVRFC